MKSKDFLYQGCILSLESHDNKSHSLALGTHGPLLSHGDLTTYWAFPEYLHSAFPHFHLSCLNIAPFLWLPQLVALLIQRNHPQENKDRRLRNE
jgi:hypothetical protein